MNRVEISYCIKSKIEQIGVGKLKSSYQSSGPINYLIIDELLPVELATLLCKQFPSECQLKLVDAMQEKKFFGVDFCNSQRIIEECLFAFQEENVLKLFSEICSIEDMVGDPELYAGGVSSMSNTCFLNPHVDNSHDRLRIKYRRLNLLYYVEENWDSSDGGQLVLYPNGIKQDPIVIDSAFNRLVIMRTDNKSLHGVKQVTSLQNRRKCISNYYFSIASPLNKEYYHSTSFRGFPAEAKKDLVLRINGVMRTTLKMLTGNFIGKVINTRHHRESAK